MQQGEVIWRCCSGRARTAAQSDDIVDVVGLRLSDSLLLCWSLPFNVHCSLMNVYATPAVAKKSTSFCVTSEQAAQWKVMHAHPEITAGSNVRVRILCARTWGTAEN
jgi:hypothetical protein